MIIKEVKSECCLWVSDSFDPNTQSRIVVGSVRGSWLNWFKFDQEKTNQRISFQLIKNPYEQDYYLVKDKHHNTCIWVSEKHQGRQVFASTLQSWNKFFGENEKLSYERLSFKIEHYQDNYVLIRDKKYQSYLWLTDIQLIPESRLLLASKKDSWFKWLKDNDRTMQRLAFQVK